MNKKMNILKFMWIKKMNMLLLDKDVEIDLKMNMMFINSLSDK